MSKPDESSGREHGISLAEAARAWAEIGLQSFGGPTGQIAVMHRVLVEERKWLSEARFLHALNYCMLLPGPEAMQLVTYAGWLMHRTLGGVIAGCLFVLPGFVSILALSLMYVGLRDWVAVSGLFFGLQAGVLAIVAQAVQKIASRVLKNGWMVGIAAAAFVAIFVFNVAFPAIIVASGAVGLLGVRLMPERFLVVKAKQAASDVDESLLGDWVPEHARPGMGRTIVTLIGWLAAWWLPVLGLVVWLGPGHVMSELALFFSGAAVVTFGGAYSVLAYVAQQAVEVHGWLQPGEMLDGLGMAETTPGPLIQVVQFVGFMGGFRESGELNPYLAATLASVLVTWVTFVPCFLWIFVGAPYVEAVRGNRALRGVLSAITAAVVGVVLNLAVWFALHTLFEEVDKVDRPGIRLPVPVVTSVDWWAVGIAAIAALLVFRFKLGMLWTLGSCAALGITFVLVKAWVA